MLTVEIIRRVKEIQIPTGRSVADVLAGEFISVFRGTGMEFDEVRPYQAETTPSIGTSPHAPVPRSSNVSLKSVSSTVAHGRHLGFPGLRFIDASKREAAAEFCALVAFSASHNDDKGSRAIHSDVEQYTAEKRSTSRSTGRQGRSRSRSSSMSAKQTNPMHWL